MQQPSKLGEQTRKCADLHLMLRAAHGSSAEAERFYIGRFPNPQTPSRRFENCCELSVDLFAYFIIK